MTTDAEPHHADCGCAGCNVETFSLQERAVFWFGLWSLIHFPRLVAALLTTFNAECLTDLARFLREVNDARRS